MYYAKKRKQVESSGRVPQLIGVELARFHLHRLAHGMDFLTPKYMQRKIEYQVK